MVLERFKYLDFKEAKTPIDLNHTLVKNKGQSKSQLEYARVLGSLMYIMNCTRPDIACAISKLSRYTSNPNQAHWIAMKRVLGYLKYTQDYEFITIIIPQLLRDIVMQIGSLETKSTSGYVFAIGGGAMSWKSSKQTCISCSTMDSEFIALDKAGEEAEWLRNFLEDIHFWPKHLALQSSNNRKGWERYA
ncbi:secreted RxLR effector protein 161-like [Nicotiana sylvestris]|uniref:secreted RxLR effector protein 161-like n=1 Tax=Nicotiana sylvestris TaxID=4096 RepID=UPI00388CC564